MSDKIRIKYKKREKNSSTNKNFSSSSLLIFPTRRNKKLDQFVLIKGFSPHSFFSFGLKTADISKYRFIGASQQPLTTLEEPTALCVRWGKDGEEVGLHPNR